MTEEDLKELEDNDKMANKIKNEIFKLNDPSEFPRLFTDEEFLEIEKNTSFTSGLEKGIEQGIEKGIEQGIEQGKEFEKLDNARKMKMKNISNKIIQEITGLSINTIASL